MWKNLPDRYRYNLHNRMSHQVLHLLHQALPQLLSQSDLKMHHLHTGRYLLYKLFHLHLQLLSHFRPHPLLSLQYLHYSVHFHLHLHYFLRYFRIHQAHLLSLPSLILLPSFFFSLFFPPDFKFGKSVLRGGIRHAA